MMRPSLLLAISVICIPFMLNAQTGADQSAPHRPLIAVNSLTGHGISDDEAATLTEVLRNEMINTGKFRVMERSEMENILKEQGFQQSGACSNDACMVEMGQLLGAEQLVAGSVGKVGKAYSINVRIISIKTSEIVANVTHNYSGPIEDLLTSEMSKVAVKLAGGKPATTAASTPRPAQQQSQMAAADQPKPAQTPKPEKKAQVKKSNTGAKVLMVAGVAVIGGTAAYVLFAKKKGSEPEPTPQPVDKTSVEFTW
jgi:TolB-like protein